MPLVVPKREGGDSVSQKRTWDTLQEANGIGEAEDAEPAKKRQKKEAAQAFFLLQKQKKEAERKERAEALERGEALPAKPVPPPLEEPPPLAPHVRALVAAASDPAATNEHLDASFSRLMAAREEVASAAARIAQRADVPDKSRRRALLRTVVDRLSCVDDKCLQLSVLSADPAITVLRKGCAKSLYSFLQAYPGSFQIADEPNAKGKMMQVVRLMGTGPPGAGNFVEEAVASERLAQQVMATLQARGGSASVSDLGMDPSIREKAKGVTAKISKFLGQHTDLFEITHSPNGELWCNLVAPGAVAGSLEVTPYVPDAVPAADGQEGLLQQLVASLQERGGMAMVSDLGQDPAVRERMRGVAAKISKFLLSRPDVFQLTTEAGTGELTCHLQEPWAAGLWSGMGAAPPPLGLPGHGWTGQQPGGAGGADAFGAFPESQRREMLTQQVVAFLQEQGGAATVSDMGKDASIKELVKGVASKLSKFLAQRPDLFQLVIEGNHGLLVCQLVLDGT